MVDCVRLHFSRGGMGVRKSVRERCGGYARVCATMVKILLLAFVEVYALRVLLLCGPDSHSVRSMLSECSCCVDQIRIR